MPNPISILLAGLFLLTAAFIYARWQSAIDGTHSHPKPGPFIIGFGAITLFFETFGIGNGASKVGSAPPSASILSAWVSCSASG